MRQRDAAGHIQSNTVLGRRYCRICGRWKHLCYFRPRRRRGREYPQSECDACHNRVQKRARKEATGDRRARRQEYERIYHEVQRRRRGIPPRNLRSRRSDGTYGGLVPVAPALRHIEDWVASGHSDSEFARVTGVTDRTLRAWRSGERTNTRFAVVDEVLTRIGRPDLVAVLYD